MKAGTGEAPVVRRVVYVLVCGLVAVAAMAFAATPASASTNDSSLTVTSTSTTVQVPSNSAGDPCKNTLGEDHFSSGGVFVAYDEWGLSFCYNNVIVTSHNVSYIRGATAAGRSRGWGYYDNVYHHFSCYVAVGSTHACSGNYEDNQDQFRRCIPILNCVQWWFPRIQLRENYHGQSFVNLS
jgi:hypothetical protein